ncbi:MAG TPA: Rrf2 family transcriptional regulator [Cyclobacteriaceae bacterium]|nr:Rrf2 family transcriptional regulator [Cyclobacteriaceae bacterium]MCB9238333.1 Rrf2 family transcriptional regulator [Flammeovirgaceae bacterium]MCB0499057.1 Rrf2 family transcriptional regulator [Cyclobacteriaceae bacterium]MCO5272015.1 Rrf2 family transcriptional regulator [Cyclobacteriaceae bacterium]MCW5902949.1 Rrf2 family transcriptional regulator [Cyclobacteriaceae bacterium]
MFSKSCEYGIKATAFIAVQATAGKRACLKDIASAIDSPVAFTAKILQQLARTGIIHSVQGATGGFEVYQSELGKITLSQIVAAIDGDEVYKGCGLGLKACNARKPCPVHDKFVTIRDELREMLEGTSVQDLAQGLKRGHTYLKR